MLLCVLLCGMVTRPGGVQLGWALQIALIAGGFVVPAMFFLGAVFAALWWASVHYGRKIDEAKARFAAQAPRPPPSRLTLRDRCPYGRPVASAARVTRISALPMHCPKEPAP